MRVLENKYRIIYKYTTEMIYFPKGRQDGKEGGVECHSLWHICVCRSIHCMQQGSPKGSQHVLCKYMLPYDRAIRKGAPFLGKSRIEHLNPWKVFRFCFLNRCQLRSNFNSLKQKSMKNQNPPIWRGFTNGAIILEHIYI